MPDTFPQRAPPPGGALPLSVHFNYRDESVPALLVTDLLHNGLYTSKWIYRASPRHYVFNSSRLQQQPHQLPKMAPWTAVHPVNQ